MMVDQSEKEMRQFALRRFKRAYDGLRSEERAERIRSRLIALAVLVLFIGVVELIRFLR